VSDLLIPMAPLLWIGLFSWAFNLTTAQTVLFQSAFAVLAMIGCALGALLGRRNGEEA
jgi:hypothetical protein